MSLNKAMNAVVALIEGRTDIAKQVLRDPTSDVKDIPSIQSRLEAAVNKAAARGIRNGLVRALSIQAPQWPGLAAPVGRKLTEEEKRLMTQAFYEGVNAVETLLSSVIYDLEPIPHNEES